MQYKNFTNSVGDNYPHTCYKIVLGDSHIRVQLETNVSETSSASIFTDAVPADANKDSLPNVGFWLALTQLVVREGFIMFMRREGFKY
jgi:hypothetical protein